MTKADQSSAVRVRYAPSPTGHWHVGGVRTALFIWLFARQHQNGRFIIRIEDTDRARSDGRYEAEIFEMLDWLDLDYDEGPTGEVRGGTWHTTGARGEYGPYRQSERTALYRQSLEQLLEVKRAYYCYCSKQDLEVQMEALKAQGLPPKYSGTCRARSAPPGGKQPETIRFVIPETRVSFSDIVRGTVEFDAGLFGDIVIAKDLDTPLYNFAAVVDDAAMRITHVVRGEEHLSNTPKQILIYRALNLPMPQYGHIPLILNADRSKLSKRHMDASVLSYRDTGYLPQALMNFLVLLGWHPKTNTEILSREDLLKQFDLSHVQKAGAIFNTDKLEWLNQEYLKNLLPLDLARQLEPFLSERQIPCQNHELIAQAAEAVRGRAATLSGIADDIAFFFHVPQYESSLLIWKNDGVEKAREMLRATRNILMHIDDTDWATEQLRAALTPLTDEHGRGSVLWPLRAALSGKRASPDPYIIASVLGKKQSLKRVDDALSALETTKQHHAPDNQ